MKSVKNILDVLFFFVYVCRMRRRFEHFFRGYCGYF